MSVDLKHLSVYPRLLAHRSYRRRVILTLLAFFGGTASVGQLVLWISGVSGGMALTISLLILIPIGAVFSLRVSRPNAEILFRHPAISSTLRISVGDLFKTSTGVLVITMSRYFDTALNMVSSRSLIAQLINRRFAGKSDEIQKHILSQLLDPPDSPQPIGHIITFPADSITYLLLAVASRNEDISSSVAVDEVWTALSKLWEFARRYNLPALRLPIIGSGYARAHVGRIPLLILLLTSYLTSAMETSLCDLEIVLDPSDTDPDLLELAKNYCELLGYKAIERKYVAEGDLAPKA